MKRRINLSNRFAFPCHDIFLLLPGLCGFGLFYLYPLLNMPYYAMISSNFDQRFVGFAHFSRVMNNRYFRLAVKNTISFSIIAPVLSVVIAFFLALFFRKVLNKVFVQSVFIIPLLVPSASVCIIFQNIFSKDGLLAFFKFSKTLSLDRLSLYFFFLWKYTGINILIILSGFSHIPSFAEEVADINGASPIKRVFYIILPMLRSTLAFTFVYSLSNSFKSFKESYVMFGDYPALQVYQIQNYMNNHFKKLDYQSLSAAGLMFFVSIAFGVVVGNAWERRISKGVY